MTCAADVASDVRQLVLIAAGPREWGETKERALERAARALGISYRRAKALHYGEIKNIPTHEYLSIVRRVEGLQQRLATRRAERDAYREAMARAGVPAPLGAVGRDERAALPAGEAGPAGDAGAERGAEPVRR